MIKIYYHIYTSSHRILGMSFVDQQLRRIYVSGLNNYAQMNCVIHGPYHKEVEEMLTRYGGWRILESIPDDPGGLRELRTLKYMHSEAEPNDIMLFLHTKGIAYASGESRIHGITMPRNLRAINSWRFALEYFCIDEWRSRHGSIATRADTESAFLNLDPYWQYAGNIYWTRGMHVLHLPDPTSITTMSNKDAARAWPFWRKGQHISLFHVLDKPREDGRYVYGTFRLHEDDLMDYLIEDRDSNEKRHQQILTPDIIHMIEQERRRQ